MTTECENRRNCSFIANDHTFKESCSERISRCTIFDYVYTCKSKYQTTHVCGMQEYHFTFVKMFT